MNPQSNDPWWGSLLPWDSSPAIDHTATECGDTTYRVAIAAVPNHYAPPGAAPASPVWCLADPATGMPGAVLSERRYDARALAEAALTEAAALGVPHLADVVDRFGGIPSLMAVLATSGPRPVPVCARLVVASDARWSRLRVYHHREATGATELAADAVPVWTDAPVPSWRVEYAGTSRIGMAESWAGAAADIIAVTGAEQHGGHRTPDTTR